MKHLALLLGAASSTAGPIRSIALGVLLLLGLVAPSQAQCNPTTLYFSQFHPSGSVGEIAVRNGVAYVHEADTHPGDIKVLIFDVSNPLSPQRVGDLGWYVGGPLWLSGSRLYTGPAAAGAPALRVFDVSTPASPQLLGTMNASFHNLVVSGGIAYTSYTNRITLFDVSNPAAMFQRSSLALPGWNIESLAIQGNLLFAVNDAGLHVVNVANPAMPVRLSSTYSSGGIYLGGYGLAVEGNYAYVTGGLNVVDISNPAAPQLVASRTGRGFYEVVVSGGRAYGKWVNSVGMTVYDISIPTNPIELWAGSPPGIPGNWTGGSNGRIAVVDGKAYTTTHQSWAIWDVQSCSACTAPSITASPASLQVCVGGSGTLNAAATGTAPLSYQWRFNGTNIPNATASSLALTNIGVNQAGSYTCTVTNACGSATTAAATITVHPAGPDITTSPLDQAICLDELVSFTVVAAGHMQGSVLEYQWFKDSLPIVGAPATATLSFTVSSPDDGGNYVCRVTEPNCGHSDSDAALLTVKRAPSITASPESLEVCVGDERTLSATATGTAPLSYQWRFNETDIAGATASSLALTSITFNHAGSYTCTVTNACGNTTTTAATIVVHPAGPDIDTQPLSQTLCLGATASFTVAARAHMQGELQYEWMKDGSPIAGAPRAATLSFPVTSLDDEGTYFCRVTEPNCGYSDSDAAVLTVNRAPSVDAGGNFSVNEAQQGVVLQGNGSDPEVGALTYAWTQLPGGTLVSLNGADTLSPTFDAPIVAVGGETLTFQLTVTDGCQSSDATVSVSIVNINHPPVAEAGVDQSVAEAAPVTLDGTASFDIDGDRFSRSWMQVSGPTVTLSGASTDNPTFTAPVINGSGAPGVVATLVFKLTVDDTYTPDAPAPGYFLSDVEDLVTIEVTNINNWPVADAGVEQTFDENAAVTLTGAGSSDPDSDTLSYAWVQVGGSPTVTLSGAATANPTFTAPFVSAGGAELTFVLTVDDGYGGYDIDTVVVNVQNVNDPPLASAARPSQAQLWPPNHGMVAISILGVTDPNNNARITITGVWQDEATNGLGDGDTPVDAIINPDGTVLIRAERAGNGNGRVYYIHFTATDLEGSSSSVVKVNVPRDKKSVAVDGGALHVSTN
ncbi:MAG: immunoglobulin domain-containing protein [Planctomycetes bacterium]|nr:immunoglobulin domain-containing protein [Planctomycetota bacterium]